MILASVDPALSPEWASVFAADEVITAAILDRLMHHGTVVNIRGQSYRLKDKLKMTTTDTLTTPHPKKVIEEE